MEPTGRESQEDGLSAKECEVVRDLVQALRNLRYGSLVLTVHDGRVVEIQKTEKTRMNTANDVLKRSSF